MAMAGNLEFGDFNLDLLLASPTRNNAANVCIGASAQMVQQPALPQSNRGAKIQRSRLAERIADIDALVWQLKQLQETNQQLTGLQNTASQVTELYHVEKQQRQELERRSEHLGERCAELEKQLDAVQLKCEDLQEQLHMKGLPFEAKDMVCVFMQMAQRLNDDYTGGLQRREHNMVRKLKDYCKTAKINMPIPKSPASKRKVSVARVETATQSTQTAAVALRSQGTQHQCATDTSGTIAEFDSFVPPAPLTKLSVCSIGVQSENLLQTRDQGTQHKNTTTTRGTTTASFIKQHDVGTCFPEPKPQPNVRQILDEMLSWNTNLEPLSPIHDLYVLPAAAQLPPATAAMVSVSTCTTLCNVQREIDFLPTIPPQIKRSHSRPPSRAMFESVKDEIPITGGSYEYVRELFNSLPHSQSALSNLPPNAFEELWQVFGQMVLGLLQRRSSVTLPTLLPNMSQTDLGNWLLALCESKQELVIPADSTDINAKSKNDYEPTANKAAAKIDVGTDPIDEKPDRIGVELLPIRLPLKPKVKTKKRKAETQLELDVCAKRRIAETTSVPETAIHFLSNLNAFHKKNCDNLGVELDAEERLLLELTTKEQTQSAASIKDAEAAETEQCSPAELEEEIVVGAAQAPHELPSVNDAKIINDLFGSDSHLDGSQEQPIAYKEYNAGSPDSYKLVIDEDICDGTMLSENQMLVTAPSAENEATVTTACNKRKRNARSPKVMGAQTEMVQRLTRLRAKQLLLHARPTLEEQLPQPEMQGLGFFKETVAATDTELKRNCDNEALISGSSTTATSNSNIINYDDSPASPAAMECQEQSDCAPLKIPLERMEHSNSEPKALLLHVIGAVRSEAKQHARHKRQINNEQLSEQLCIRISAYLNDSVDIVESACNDLAAQLHAITNDEGLVMKALIITYIQMESVENSALQRWLALLRHFESQQHGYVQRFMHAVEQRMFRLKERRTVMAHKCLKLYLQLIPLQQSLIAAHGYTNPARLLIAKILYHYSTEVPLLVLEVVSQYPTALPHREQRDYDHADPLITVIKHLLMSYKYDMTDPKSADRDLLSKLRFEYHFQPFEPTKQQVLDNLLEKLKAGKVQQLCYAFALFCRRSTTLRVESELIAGHLLPLACSYTDLCMQTPEYDARLVSLLQCLSMIVKQMPIDTNISASLMAFKRLLMAAPSATVQQAAAQAILRLQRFGYKHGLEALQNYRPNYELQPMTRAMLCTFAQRRLQYQQQGAK